MEVGQKLTGCYHQPGSRWGFSYEPAKDLMGKTVLNDFYEI
jgi:hypothetical protein